MVNPLRVPIVLILVLAGMLVFVHASHRKTISADVPMVRASAIGAVKFRKDDAEAVEPSLVRNATEARTAGNRSEVPITTAIASTAAVVEAPVFRQTPRDPGVEPLKLAAQVAPANSSPRTGGRTRRVVVRRANTRRRVMHRIVDGDTLERIAEKHFGDRGRAAEIYEANRELLVVPDLLPIGEKLEIPQTVTK